MFGLWVREGVVLTAILALGFLLSTWFRGSVGTLSRASLVFPLGSGALTLVVFLASWLGVSLEPLNVLLVTVACLLAAGGSVAFAKWRGTNSRISPVGDRGVRPPVSRVWVVAALVGISLMGLLTAVLGVAHSYSAWDDMAIWSLKGYGIALERTIFAAAKWGAHGLDYPLNVPLQVALFRILGGDALPESKILFPLSYVSLLIGCLGFWLEQGVRDRQAVAGVALLASVPAIFLQATIGYANLHLTTYLVLGTLQAAAGIARADRRRQALAGVLLGLAAWTRPEGVLLDGVVIATLLGIRWVTRKGQVNVLSLLTPLVMIIIPWLLFSRIYVPQSEGQQGLAIALQSIYAGRPELFSIPLILRWNLRLAVTPSVWGLLIPVSGLLVVLGLTLPRRKWPHDTGLGTLAVAITIAAAEVFYWYISVFHGDIPAWKDFDFSRHFAPAAILLGVAGILIGAKRTRDGTPGRLGGSNASGDNKGIDEFALK